MIPSNLLISRIEIVGRTQQRGPFFSILATPAENGREIVVDIGVGGTAPYRLSVVSFGPSEVATQHGDPCRFAQLLHRRAGDRHTSSPRECVLAHGAPFGGSVVRRQAFRDWGSVSRH